MQLDIGWAYVGGQNVIEMFQTNPGRYELWHVKDAKYKELDPKMKPSRRGHAAKIVTIGEGDIDYRAVFVCQDCGTETLRDRAGHGGRRWSRCDRGLQNRLRQAQGDPVITRPEERCNPFQEFQVVAPSAAAGLPGSPRSPVRPPARPSDSLQPHRPARRAGADERGQYHLPRDRGIEPLWPGSKATLKLQTDEGLVGIGGSQKLQMSRRPKPDGYGM